MKCLETLTKETATVKGTDLDCKIALFGGSQVHKTKSRSRVITSFALPGTMASLMSVTRMRKWQERNIASAIYVVTSEIFASDMYGCYGQAQARLIAFRLSRQLHYDASGSSAIQHLRPAAPTGKL